MQDAAGLVLLPRWLELPATHASAAVLAHAAGSGGAVLDAANWIAVLVDTARGAVAVLPLLTVLHVVRLGGFSQQDSP
jgi:hypothetical protein